MTYSIDRNKAKEIAKMLDLEVSFDSQTPGVQNTLTGKKVSLHNYFFDDYFNQSNYETKEKTKFEVPPIIKNNNYKMNINIDKKTTTSKRIAFESICAWGENNGIVT